MATPTLVAALDANRRAAQEYLTTGGQAQLLMILKGAEVDLEARIAQSLKGVGTEAFTTQRLQATLVQVRLVTAQVQKGIMGVVAGRAGPAAAMGVQHALSYLEAAEKKFTGAALPLRLREALLVDQVAQGLNTTILARLGSSGQAGSPLAAAHPGKLGILQRYGMATIRHFEEMMQRGLVSGASLTEMRTAITAKSPFLQQAPRYWAERIVRTECLVGDTPVTGAVVRAAFRRWYEGPMVEVITEGGRKFTTTPNHPMLTRRAWVSTNGVRPGDYLVCHRGEEHPLAPGYQDIDHRPTTIAELFDSLSAVGVRERYRGGEPDFHGDGMQGDVDVHRIDRPLRFGVFAPLFEHQAKLIFAPSHVPPASAFCPSCRRLLSVQKQTCLCHATNRDIGFLQAALHHAGVHAQVAADCLGTLARLIFGHDPLVGQVEPTGMLLRMQPQEGRLGASARNPVGVGNLLHHRVVDANGGIDVLGGHAAGIEAQRVLQFIGRVSRGPSEAAVLQDPHNPRASDSHVGGDFSGGETAGVEFDRVVSTRVLHFRGHVYNLHTSDGYFLIQGAYTGNTIGVYNRSGFEAIRHADTELGDMVKILCATFDDRTGSDSYAVHGQIRRPEQAFESWFGLCQHPPNRPNDREVVVPHRISWPLPEHLMPKSDGAVSGRWRHEGRKGSPPPRPNMSTVDRALFGKEQPPVPEAETQVPGRQEPRAPGRLPSLLRGEGKPWEAPLQPSTLGGVPAPPEPPPWAVQEAPGGQDEPLPTAAQAAVQAAKAKLTIGELHAMVDAMGEDADGFMPHGMPVSTVPLSELNDELKELGKAPVTKMVKVSKLHLPGAGVDPFFVKDALSAAKGTTKPTVVKKGGKLHVVGDKPGAVAASLMGKKNLAVHFVDLDASPNVPTLPVPAVPPAPAASGGMSREELATKAAAVKSSLQMGSGLRGLEGAKRQAHLEHNAQELRKLDLDEEYAVKEFTYGYDFLIRALERGVSRETLIEQELAHRKHLSRFEAETRVTQAEKYVNQLASAHAKMAPAKHAPVVYRGIALSDHHLNKMLVDDEVRMHSTSSASTMPSKAFQFANNNKSEKTPNTVMLKVRHQTGVGIENISRLDSEREVLLKRGSRYKVVSRGLVTEGGSAWGSRTHHLIELKEIGEGEMQQPRARAQRAPKG